MKDWSKIYDIREGTYSSNFRLYNPNSFTKGDTYTDTEQSWTNLSMHETMTDLLETINHEEKHAALKRQDMNEDVEHEILKRMNWAETFLDQLSLYIENDLV